MCDTKVHDILEEPVTKKYRKSYDQLCIEYYFDKYQMNSSVSEYNQNIENVVQGLNEKGKPIPNPYFTGGTVYD